MRKLLKKQGYVPRVLVTDKLLRETGASPESPARAGPTQEQPGGELAPAGTTARAQDAALQVGWISAALSQLPFRSSQHLQHPAPSRLPPHPPPVSSGGDACAAERNGSGLSRARSGPCRPEPVDVTVPLRRYARKIGTRIVRGAVSWMIGATGRAAGRPRALSNPGRLSRAPPSRPAQRKARQARRSRGHRGSRSGSIPAATARLLQ
jgi:hypothetical protein